MFTRIYATTERGIRLKNFKLKDFFRSEVKKRDESRFKIAHYKVDDTFNITLQDETGMYYQEEKFSRKEIRGILARIQDVIAK